MYGIDSRLKENWSFLDYKMARLMKAGTSWNLSAPTMWKRQRGNRVTGRKVIRLGRCEHCFLVDHVEGIPSGWNVSRDHQDAIVGRHRDHWMSSAMELCYNEHTELGTNDFHYGPFNFSKYWTNCKLFMQIFFGEHLLVRDRYVFLQ